MTELTTSVLATHHAVAVQALQQANVMAYDHAIAKRQAREARRAGQTRWWHRSRHTVAARHSAAITAEC